MFPPAGVLNQQPQGYAALLTGLKCWYPMQETGTADRVDAHGVCANIVKQAGGLTNSPGHVGSTSMDVAGDTWSPHCGNESNLNFTSDFTAHLWFRSDVTGVNDEFLVSKNSASTGWRIGIRWSTSQALVGIRSLVLLWGSTLSATNWYQLVGWYDSTADLLSLSINNGTPVTTSDTTGPTSNTNVVRFGGEFSNWYDGRMEQFAAWNRVLTADERTWLYNAGAGRTYADL